MQRFFAVAAVAVVLAAAESAAGQEPPGRRDLAVTFAADVSTMRRADALVDALARSKALAPASRRSDPHLPRRAHESFRQVHEGVPVQGGGVSRQSADGVTVSIFGTLHRDIEVDTTPRVAAAEALALLERQTGAGPATREPPTLVILPTLRGTYVLAWRATLRDRRTYFLDAHRGRIVRDRSLVDGRDGAVGAGRGIRGQRRKLSTRSADGGFRAHDRLRPAETVTLDMRHDEDRVDYLIDPGDGIWSASDVAYDADNDWDDRAVVDAHAYAGFTYDYLALRLGWNGIDGRNGRVMSMVNIGREADNAFFIAPPFGPEGTGLVAFGHLDGTPLVAADIVAHELMHGVTHFAVTGRTGATLEDSVWAIPAEQEAVLPGGFTPACGERYEYPPDHDPFFAGRAFSYLCSEGRLLLFAAHGGAVNEAYSDIVGTAVEFALHEPPIGPLRADYLSGEDTGTVIRALDDPGSLLLSSDSEIPYPDAVGGMVWFLVQEFEDDGRAYFTDIGSVDAGRTLTLLPTFGYAGDHWNSTILSHAFYLAVEGGRNRTTGRTVRGVGDAGRHDVERAFLRAMTHLMPNSPNLWMTADIIRQSAVDLFGFGSPAHRAVDQALRAVGLDPAVRSPDGTG